MNFKIDNFIKRVTLKSFNHSFTESFTDLTAACQLIGREDTEL
jgi:hypothetical protein